MRNIVFIIIVFLLVSCKSEIYVLFHRDQNIGVNLHRKDHRYYYAGASHGDWVKKGRYIILNSDLDPEKIEGISLGVTGSTNPNMVISVRHAITGAIIHDVTIFLYNKEKVKEVELSFPDSYYTISKSSFDYDSISVMIPLWFERYKYSFSSKIPMQMGDTVSISISAGATGIGFLYFNNRAFIKKGKMMVDPITLKEPYLY